MPAREVTVPAMPSEISPAFDGHVQATAALLHLLRTLIFEVADETPGIGELTETLKWGQPSYTPKKPRIGSSVRLSATDDGRAAVWFICHTHLVDRFRETGIKFIRGNCEDQIAGGAADCGTDGRSGNRTRRARDASDDGARGRAGGGCRGCHLVVVLGRHALALVAL